MSFPALKEWQVVIEALGSGEQIFILRKGGIAEGRGGFQIQASRFWLFPTRFHAQLEKTKPAAAKWFTHAPSSASGEPADAEAGDETEAAVTLRYFADVVHTVFLADWTAIQRLDPHHIWTEATIRERFDWSRPPGLHALVLQVHQVTRPVLLPPSPAFGGCKSWIDVPAAFDSSPSVPVFSDADLAGRRAVLSL